MLTVKRELERKSQVNKSELLVAARVAEHALL